MEVGFAGLEDDYEVCRRIFLYAYDCVKSKCREIQEENRALGVLAEPSVRCATPMARASQTA